MHACAGPSNKTTDYIMVKRLQCIPPRIAYKAGCCRSALPVPRRRCPRNSSDRDARSFRQNILGMGCVCK